MDRWAGQALLIALVALTLAVGLCLFDDDDRDNDLCSGLAIFLVAVFLATLGRVHLVLGGSSRVAYAVSLRRQDPPPKFPPSPSSLHAALHYGREARHWIPLEIRANQLRKSPARYLRPSTGPLRAHPTGGTMKRPGRGGSATRLLTN